MTTPHLTIIAAVGRDLAIGRDGDLAFHISADLRRFKALTMGHPIIMGRKTFESFPKGALPGRRNIVVTRNSAYSAPGIETAGSLEEALGKAGEKAFVIGGGEIYRQALPLAHTLEITEIDADTPDADTRFPDYRSGWQPVAVSEPETDPRTGVTYRFVTLSPRRG